jgi:hypothetical protein
VATGLFVSTLAALWVLKTVKLDVLEQRNVAETATAWGLNACVSLGLAGLAGLVTPLFQQLGNRRIFQIFAVGVAVWAIAGLAPRTHRIFFDEQIYMQVGQTFAHTGRLSAAGYARAEHGLFELYQGEMNKQPQGWPYVYGQASRFFGVSPRLGQEINRVATGATAALLCLALMLSPWRLPAAAPVAAGLAWGLTPLVPWWGRTAAVEPMSAATIVAAFCAAILYARLRSSSPICGRPAAGALLAATTAFAGYFRPESLLVFPLVAAVLWAEEDDFVRDTVAWGTLAFAFALIAPNLAQLWSVRSEDWGATDGQRFNFSEMGKNLYSNFTYFFFGRYFPLAATGLALVGLGWLLAYARSAAVVLAVWFLPAWGTFVLFYAGGYHYGASNRYALISAAPVAIAIGIGAGALISWGCRRPAWLGLAGSLVAISWTRASTFLPYQGREALEAQQESQFVESQAKSLPSGSLIISQVPSMWLIEGRNSALWFAVENLALNNLNELANQYPGGIYLHYGYWEHADEERGNHAAQVIVQFQGREIARLPTHAMNFAIYRLDTPEALARFGGPPTTQPERRKTELDNALARARAASEAVPLEP